MTLDVERATRAMTAGVAGPLGLTAIEGAHAIHRLVNENMASAARVHAIERGKHPGAYPLFAFGGAGPVHAVGVARILGARHVIVPMGAGVASAAGLLTAPFAFDFVRSYRCRLDAVHWERVRHLFDDMTAEGIDVLTRAGLPREAIQVRRLCAMRYVGQGSELEVGLDGARLDAANATAIREDFERVYRARYSTVVPGVPVEILTWQLSVAGPRQSVTVRLPVQGSATAHKGERSVYFGRSAGWVTAPVYDRYALGPGMRLRGPAIVEERESTTVVDPAVTLAVDPQQNLILTLE